MTDDPRGEVAGGCVNAIGDDPDMRGAIGSLPRSCGPAVRLFDGPAAYLAAEAPASAACLGLDIRLSGESGLDFQERIAGRAHAVPVVPITGHGDIPMTVRGMRAGAADFLPRPFGDDRLPAAVETALAADRARRAESTRDAAPRAPNEDLTPREKAVMALVVTGLTNRRSRRGWR